jgi:A/G-specific adenine glycosylase
MPKAPDPSLVRRAILRWYARNGRPFPWRGTRDPYRVLLSEIMLQQTQADRVAARFPLFLEIYPDIDSLANAPRADVLRAWRGMGYNNRAVRLHGAVKEVVAKYGGNIPRDTGELESLPGIGKYTAHAVACFAHGRKVPVVDVNIRRALSRIFRPMKTLSAVAAEQDAWDLAQAVLPADAYTWNQALMDFGAMVCPARTPKCGDCPVNVLCLSARFLRDGTAGALNTRYAALKRKQIADGTTGGPPGPGRPKPEPSHRGIPRRIWRGRVVEALRASDGPRSIPELRKLVRPSGKPASLKWLGEVVGRLEKDGVVEVRFSGRRTAVALAP